MKIFSATLVGVKPIPIEIEIDLSDGMPFFQIVGLPDAVLKESKTRVKSAILQSDFQFPFDSRLVLNLAPSKLKKEGSGFELALAARILASTKQIQLPHTSCLFLGELALDGSVRSVTGIHALTFAALQNKQIEYLVLPKEACDHVDFHISSKIIGIEHIRELTEIDWWKKFSAQKTKEEQAHQIPIFNDTEKVSPFWAKHLKIALTGKHHYLLCGPPGCGKTYFAETLRRLSISEKDRELKVLDSLFKRDSQESPWASPHHSVTSVGLLGGGTPPKPGALTKAHGGILFLDELLEFSPSVLDSLREPLERGEIDIYRAGDQVTFPARVQLIAATNPCRCGYWKNEMKPCWCHPKHREQYLAKMSGPFMDRLDIKVFCNAKLEPLSFVSMKSVVQEIIKIKNYAKHHQAQWPDSLETKINLLCRDRIINMRSFNKVKSVAKTLALCELKAQVTDDHVLEAISYQDIKEKLR